jgi:hypothetical protein
LGLPGLQGLEVKAFPGQARPQALLAYDMDELHIRQSLGKTSTKK